MSQVILVDRDDKEQGFMEKQKAHELGLLHRAFSIFIFESSQSDLKLLLQKRAHHKYHCAGLWTNSCCSHPLPNESLKDAVNRRLNEELGFSCDLQKTGSFIYKSKLDNALIEHEYDHVFIGSYAGQTIKANPDEVEVVEWCSCSELIDNKKQYEEQFTPWFFTALQIAIDGYLSLDERN